MAEVKDKRSETSAENGKKGGRPVSPATIRAQAARDYISAQTQASLGPIVAKAITQAMEGNKDAREWLSDQGWGKPQQRVNLTTKDDPMIDDEILAKARAAIGAILPEGDTE